MHIKRVFLGGERQLTFRGVEFPLHEVPSNMTFDALSTDCRIVPYDYRKGDFLFTESSEELRDKQALDLVWTISGNKREVSKTIHVFSDYVHNLEEFMKGKSFHASYRILWSDNPAYKPREIARLVMIRVFWDGDFDCKEHPEMLNGEPIGMYHCPECANMQVAGLIHMRDNQ